MIKREDIKQEEDQDNQLRTNRFVIMLTEEEREDIESMARRESLPASAAARRILLTRARSPMSDKRATLRDTDDLRSRLKDPDTRQGAAVEFADFAKDLVIFMGGEPKTAYAVAGAIAQGLTDTWDHHDKNKEQGT